MRPPVSPALLCYLSGLLATFAGAWLMDATGSMWPLALGGAASLMCTVPVVKGLLRAMAGTAAADGTQAPTERRR